MDNQQGKNDGLAWLAGFVDGEGSFMVIQCTGKRMERFKGRGYAQTRITLVNTHFPTLEAIKEICAENELPYYISTRIGGVSSSGAKYADSWDVRVQGFRRCKKWCEALLPHLRTKKSRAEAMLQLVDTRLAHSYKDYYSDGELALMQSLRTKPRFPHRLHACPA